jgi:hypothetical protein
MKTITIHEALKSVSDHCDHARTHDTVGFSGLDAAFANKMATADRITAKMEWYCARFVRKYRRQVVENFERNLGGGLTITQGLKGKAKVAAIDTFLANLVWEHQSVEEVAACAPKPTKVISAACGERSGDLKNFVVRFPYNYATVEAFKNAIDWRDRKFNKDNPKDPKWEVLAQPGTVRALRAFAAANGFTVTDGAANAMERVVPSQVAA